MDFIKLLPIALLLYCAFPGEAAGADDPPPNFVLIFTDDQGYQDVGCFGSPMIKTPHLDRMAAEGMRFTDFYVGAPVCSASRASLMTGSYCDRVSVKGVFFPNRRRQGLHPDEVTVAEVLKGKGYATACVGKWHLGDEKPFLPTRQGFDRYFGIPYSNDMSIRRNGKRGPPLMLGEEIVEHPAVQATLTKRYTEEAVRFIEANKDRPFFLYLPHTMPHVPLDASEKFRGKSPRGLYGDVIEEIDWSVGEILGTLKKLGIDGRTLVVFTSDNGPWLSKGENGGSALPLRDGKFTTFEGGMRVPCIMRWPGRIPAGKTCGEIAATIDILPTFATLAGAKVAAGRVIDGRSIVPLIEDRPGAKSPHEAYFLRLDAVRAGRWKFLLKGRSTVKSRPAGPFPALYDLENDIAETTNVAAEHPEVVERLTKLIQAHRQEIQRNRRPVGQVEGAQTASREGRRQRANRRRRRQEGRARPNILYIMSDDHSTNAVGAYNGWLKKHAPTPNIDRLAREGLRFDNCFCTNSICTPSRASIITGQYSHVNGVLTLKGRLREGQPSFPRDLQRAGYQTAVVGKWHLRSTPRGFDYYEVLPGQGAYFNPRFTRDGEQTKYEGYSTDIITDLSLEWLKKRDKEKPFLLLCHHKAPHGRWEYAPRHRKMYAGVDLPEPPTLHNRFENASTALKQHFRNMVFQADRMAAGQRGRAWPTGRLDTTGMDERQKIKAAYQKYVKDYLRCVAAVDESVGRLLKFLDDEGLTENTVVVYTSDQGMFLGEHGYIDKRLILEESLRMPLIIRYPGVVEAGSVNDAIVLNVDFAGTLLEISGLPVPKVMQGRSFLPLLKGETPANWRTSSFYAYWGGATKHYGVRTRRHKLAIHHTGERDLFDLEKDPLERRSEISNPEYAGVLRELERELERLKKEVGITDDQLPGKR